MNPFKVKVDYTPIGVDVDALRAGNYVELLNLFPLESMELDLKSIRLRGLTGWGSLFGEFAKLWVNDIAATQLHKFVQSAPPFQTISNLGGATADLVMLPVQHFR